MMKKFILIIVFYTAFYNGVYSQKKEEKIIPHSHWGHGSERQEAVVHKYLTIQAWDVVRAQHPEVIGTEMDMAMRNPVSGNYGDWWSNEYDLIYTGNIVSGSFREDSEDIIWGENNISVFGVQPFVSITHFWVADLGDDHEPMYYGVHRNNALQKMRSLWRGQKFVENNEWPKISLDGWSNTICIEHNPTVIYKYEDLLLPGAQNSVKEVFLNPLLNMVANERWALVVPQGGQLPTTCQDFHFTLDPPQPLTDYSNRLPSNWNPELYKKICWTVVGRIAHLIGDQGVPAHTHFDTHVAKVGDEDYYERVYMFDQDHKLDLTSEKALLQGGLIDLTGKEDPLRYALYTTNQVADRFPSNDDDGNTVIDRSHPDNYAQILDPIYANIQAGLSQFGDNPPPGLMEEIAENAGIYSIRAIAGFLYWVFQQFQIQPNIPADIVINNQTIPDTRTFIASNTITTQNTVNIQSTGNVTLKAGTFIKLNKGTSIKAGSNFYAKIEDITNLMRVYSGNTNVSSAMIPEETGKDVSSKEQLNPLIPKEYAVFQNYPNPFNPVTTIQFDIPKSSFVKLTIFDISGREISNVVNAELNAGRYQYQFDGSGLASGIYFYKIVAGDFVSVKKMSLIK